MTDTTTGGQQFEPPGPGSWNRDPVHFPRPVTAYLGRDASAEPFKQGTNNFARYYGLLIDGLQIAYVNGFAYNQVRPAPDAEIPAAVPAGRRGAGRRSSGASSCGSGTRSTSPPASPSTARSRPSIPTRSPTTSSPRT